MIAVLTVLVGLVVGDKFSYVILKSLYMQNRRSKHDEDVDGEGAIGALETIQSQFDKKHERQSNWLGQT